MIPEFDVNGLLPPGIHAATWDEFGQKFGDSSFRQKLLTGLRKGLDSLRIVGCKTVYIDGSFVTKKEQPNDYDVCWDVSGVDPIKLDPVLLDFNYQRTAQKVKYYGDFFPAQTIELSIGKTFLDFFQIDKDTGDPKGIIKINLGSL